MGGWVVRGGVSIARRLTGAGICSGLDDLGEASLLDYVYIRVQRTREGLCYEEEEEVVYMTSVTAARKLITSGMAYFCTCQPSGNSRLSVLFAGWWTLFAQTA